MKKVAWLLTMTMILTLLAGCGDSDKGEAPVQSVSMICGMGASGLAERFAGVVSPQGETAVRADDKIAVDKILVAAGDEVIEGQDLFTYDMEQIRSDLERASLELEIKRSQLEDYRQDKVNYEKILEDSFTSEEQKRTIATDIRQVNADIRSKEMEISTKQKEIERLNTTLRDATVTAPVSGVVKAINEKGGTDDYGNPLPLMTIVDTGGYRVKGYVNENNAASLSPGMSVLLRSRVDDRVWYGMVDSIDWNNPVQGSNTYHYGGDDDTARSNKYPFYVTLSSSDGLLLGQHVYIEPDYGQAAEAKANTIRLPAWYICDLDSRPYVWAQGSNGKLEKRNLTLGDYDEALETYVVESGLTAQDYIAFPDESLVTGMTCVTYDAGDFSGGDGDFPGGDAGFTDSDFPGGDFPEGPAEADFAEEDFGSEPGSEPEADVSGEG